MKTYFKTVFKTVVIILAIVFVNISCDDDESFETGSVSITGSDVASAFQLTDVTLQGGDFSLVQFVFVGEVQADFTLSDGTLTFTVPLNATVGNAIVTLAMANNFRVTHPLEVLLRPTPNILRFDAWVPVGEEMLIEGLSFNQEYNLVVTIGGVPATITSNTDTELSVTVPSVPDDEFLDISITSIHGETTASTPFLARENLLPNGDLYDGSGDEFTDWEVLNPGNGLTELIGDAAFGGGRSMRVQPTGGNPWDTQLASKAVVLEMDAVYTVVWWAKAEAEGAEMRISASQYNHHGAGSDYFYSHGNGEVGFEISSAGWVAYSATFTVGADLPDHKIVFDMGRGNIPFAIDHMALVPGVFSAGGEAPSVLINGDFEDGLDGWDSLNGTHEISTAEFYCGSNSLMATSEGANPWDVQIGSTFMDLIPGTDYEISFWAKASAPDGEFRVSMSRFASGQSDDYFYSPTLAIPEEWAYFSFVTTAQETTTGNSQLLFDMGGGTQIFYVDAVSVREYDPPAVNYVVNGDFEDDLNNWESINGTQAVSTDAHSGSASMTATSEGANPWDVQVGSEFMDLIPGTDYKVSFWAKAAGPDGTFRVSMSRFASGASDDYFYSPTLEITEEWAYYAFVTTAGETTTGNSQLLFDMGGNTQTFFIDDVIISEYTDPCD